MASLTSFYKVIDDPSEAYSPLQLVASFHQLQHDSSPVVESKIKWQEYPYLYESQQGVESTTVWAAMDIDNAKDSALNLMLVVDHMIAPYDTTVWQFDGETQLTESLVGERYAFSQRTSAHRNYLVPINIEVGGKVTLLIRTRVTGDKSYLLNHIELYDEREYFLQDSKTILVDGFYYGLSFFLMAASLLLSARLKNFPFLYYSAFIFFTMVYLFSGDGYGAQYLWQDSTWLNRRAEYIGRFSAFAFVLSLSIQTLGRITMHRKLLMSCQLAIGFAVLGILGCIFFPTNYSLLMWIMYSVFVLTPVALVLIVYSMVLWYKGDGRGKQYFLTWGPYIAFTALAPLLVLTQVIAGADTLALFAKPFILLASFAIFLSMSLRLGQLKNEQRKAIADSKAKSEFLAKMSHEIRTPMNGVLGMSELLSDTELSDVQKNYNDTIFSSGQALLNVIDDILDYSKITAGKVEIEAVDFNAERLLQDCTNLFTATLREKNIELLCRLAPGMPVVFSGDESRIRQVVLNLVGNAFKFTEHGEIVINVEPAIASGLIRFSVRDTGIGITREQREKLFSSFTQADASTSRKYGGTGLGLTICKQLVELMGGEIGIESTFGLGSTFWFELPLETVSDGSYRSPVSIDALKNSRLLMVEDNKTYCDIVSETFEGQGVDIDIASNGEEGLTAFDKAVRECRPYDLISTDIDMPVMNGIDFMGVLHERCGENGPIRVILSATSALPRINEYRRWGVSSAMKKPALASELLVTFAKLLGLESVVETESGDEKIHNKEAKLHVLVAEDNVVNFHVVSAFLAKLGHTSDRAENGLRAVEKYKSQNLDKNSKKYDLILMDCEMPEIDGFKASEIIRQLEMDLGLSACPIIALTAHAVKERLDKCITSGMNDYIVKPISMASIAEKISGVLEVN